MELKDFDVEIKDGKVKFAHKDNGKKREEVEPETLAEFLKGDKPGADKLKDETSFIILTERGCLIHQVEVGSAMAMLGACFGALMEEAPTKGIVKKAAEKMKEAIDEVAENCISNMEENGDDIEDLLKKLLLAALESK